MSQTDNTLCIFANCKNERLLYSNFCQKHEDSKLKEVKADQNTLDKLEWLVRIVNDSHHSCEYRQDGVPRTSVKCAGCSHSSESYERSVQNVLNYVAHQKKQAEVQARDIFVGLLEDFIKNYANGYAPDPSYTDKPFWVIEKEDLNRLLKQLQAQRESE